MSSLGKETKWEKQLLDKVEERVFLLLGNSPTWVGTLTAQFFVTKLSIEEYYPLVYYTSSVEHRASFVSPVLAVYKLCNRKKKHGKEKRATHLATFLCKFHIQGHQAKIWHNLCSFTIRDENFIFCPCFYLARVFCLWCLMGCSLHKSDWLPGAGTFSQCNCGSLHPHSARR